MLMILLVFLLYLLLVGANQPVIDCAADLAVKHVRNCCHRLVELSSELLVYLEKLEARYGSLRLDDELPSLYMYKSVAQFELRDIRGAGETLNKAVHYYPKELRAWANLADIRSLVDGIGDKNEAGDMVEKLSGQANMARRLKRIMWENYEANMALQEYLILQCAEKQTKQYCEDSAASVSPEFTNVNGSSRNSIQQYFARSFHVPTPVHQRGDNVAHKHSASIDPKPLRIGFILALVDGGPVNALSQSLIRSLNRTRCTVVAFVMVTSNYVQYDWVGEYLQGFDRVHSLSGLNDSQSAKYIAEQRIDVLIDPNGYNFLTGIHVMKYRPAPLQLNFLGDPLSAGQDFIDYYVGDPLANPPDITATHFMEKFLNLPVCYLTNSHNDKTQDLLIRPRPRKRDLLISAPSDGTPATWPVATRNFRCTNKACSDLEDLVLIGAFHSYVKFDPVLFQVWMNILHRVPIASIVFIANPGDAVSMQNLVTQAQYHGIQPHRVLFLSLTHWFAHMHFKTALDLYVDTVHKNGHTTTVDAAWAGLPTVALGAQRSAPRRSAESILHHAAENTPGVVYSLKEYETLVVQLIATRRGRARLAAWRAYTQRARLYGDLFNTRLFADAFLHSMEAVHEFSRLKDRLAVNSVNISNYHVFHPVY